MGRPETGHGAKDRTNSSVRDHPASGPLMSDRALLDRLHRSTKALSLVPTDILNFYRD